MKASSLLLGAAVVVGGYLVFTKFAQPAQSPLDSLGGGLGSLGKGLSSVGSALGSIFGGSSSSGTTDPITGTIADPNSYNFGSGSPVSSSTDNSGDSGPITSPDQIARVDTSIDLHRTPYGSVRPPLNSLSNN